MTAENALVGGRYRLDQPIGRGRAGIIWQAYDTRLHRTVAAKRLYVPSSPDPVRTESAITAALQQAHDSSRLTHASAITPREVLRDGSHAWAIMEYVPSRRMTEFLAEHGRLTPEQAASLGAQVAAALAAAHSVGLVHRAVEPGNVLLADDGGVKVTDVGIVGAGPDRAYAAPETRGGPATAASDVFSLGATLYTAVEGEPPFGTDGGGEARASTQPGALSDLFTQLLAVDPSVRPAMSDVATALTAISEGLPAPVLSPAPRAATAIPPKPVPMPMPMPAQQTAGMPTLAPTMSSVPVQQLSLDQPTQRVHPVPPPRTAPAVDGPPPDQGAPIRTDRSSLIRAWSFVVVAVLVAAGVGILFAELFLL
ncbi:serine/threonine protein kinase [Amycolatopsis antarctica]|uniref:non-specific serine/threonine protein kinase n=1 Tax=Amycolatopsis antarctica TaxID=1854586 RepID=A0A263D8Y9_9PSEU|nr:serine/threonine-protein kinase [Amycolatopsis antarctica]OZM74950.1 serine/threonine protein kinase [Amycolatopsis antarctica]